jgi:hypothetical protein
MQYLLAAEMARENACFLTLSVSTRATADSISAMQHIKTHTGTIVA